MVPVGWRDPGLGALPSPLLQSLPPPQRQRLWYGVGTAAVNVPVTAGITSTGHKSSVPCGKANAAELHKLTRSKLASCNLQLL